MTEEGNGPGETNLTAETASPFSKAKPRKPPRAEEASKEDVGGKTGVETGAAEKPVAAPEKPAAAPDKPPAPAEKQPAPPAQAAGGTVNKAKDQAAPKVMSTAERMRFRRRRR
jgi:hypothetical protein